MDTLNKPQIHNHVTAMEQQLNVAVIIVPFPIQGHLNQQLQLSCLISSYGIPVHFVSSSLHNRQARARVNGLNPLDVAKICFHDLPMSTFSSPPPNPNSLNKFPSQLEPVMKAAIDLHQPFANYLRDMSFKAKRVVVIHDSMMASVVQDVTSIHNAESYSFNCVPAFCQAWLDWEKVGKPDELPKELPPFAEDLPDQVKHFVALQNEHLHRRAGDIYNTCRLMEAPYLDLLAKEEVVGSRRNWAIGPILPATVSSTCRQHECLEWLDKQEPKSVIYVTFGTTTSLSDEQIEELALGLEQSKQKFLWVLRDADKGDIFDKEVRRPRLPNGFEERVKGVGMVYRDWAPQPEILAHSSTGGYMSHCGWNSSIESITMGVPIAAWPMHSDQPINTVFITEILKTGLVVREWAQRERLVKALTIDNAVKRLMATEEGNEIRKRAEELAATLRQATEEGGVSRLELDAFVAHITRE